MGKTLVALIESFEAENVSLLSYLGFRGRMLWCCYNDSDGLAGNTLETE